MKIAIGIEYCGSLFFGWQRQNHLRTVQVCLEQALAKVANHNVTVHCAGRTDTGVHALQQVAHFESPSKREMYSWVLGGNSNLPSDVSILWATPVAENFHARFSATSRSYRYIICNRKSRPAVLSRRVTWEHRPLDVKKMEAASTHLLGEHDFTSFRGIHCQAKTPVRQIYQISLSKRNDCIFIDIKANAFLHHMVRNIVGVLLAVGLNRENTDWVREVLEAKDRTAAGVTAPADGLYLVDISYPKQYNLPENTYSITPEFIYAMDKT